MTRERDTIDFIAEDPAPNTDLGGGPEDVVEADDPDTSPEALEALDAFSGRFDSSVESATIPEVRWSEDKDQPDYAHLQQSALAQLALSEEVAFTYPIYELLLRANRFRPSGTNGLICLGLRGGELMGDDAQINKTAFTIKDTRPNHRNFRCTLGLVDTASKQFSAFRGSTVPNTKWMRNYYKIKNNIPTNSKTRSNCLPTGCYVYRVNAHGGGKIKPALRMTDPDDLKSDATCTVLRTSNDLAYAHDDHWHPSTPYDNIHCAYFDDQFSSAGCQTIKGANKKGPWGTFQKTIGALGWNARIDYVLLTGREVAIAAAIIKAGREDDAAFVDACLGRLRVGSQGEDVTRLQKKIGFNGSGYFGPLTKKRLTEREGAQGLTTDGVYSLADDLATGWSVFETAQMPVDTPSPQVADSDPSVLINASTEIAPEKIVFRNEPGTQVIDIATEVTLKTAAGDVPLQVNANISGIPQSGVGVELVLRTTALAAPAAVKPAVVWDAAGLDEFAPRALPEYRAVLLEKGADILGQHGINENPRRLSHFMAQLHHESGGFALKSENLSYSAARLVQVWPNRFPSIAAANPFARNPEKLGNAVYGGRLGNNSPGDGFRYRGRGMIQLTGKDNYDSFGQSLGVDLVANPDLAAEPEVALRVAALYWAERKRKGERTMNALADDDKLRAITYRINGGFTGFEHREAAVDQAKAIWGDITLAAAPRIVERGDFDDEVRKLQLLLIEHRVLGGKVDGKFGNGTYKGLFKFKTDHRMQGAGFADAATFAKLRQESRPAPTESFDMLPMIEDEPEPIRPPIMMFDGDAAMA